MEIYALVGSNEVLLQGADFSLVSEYKPGVPLLVSVRGRVANPVTRGNRANLESLANELLGLSEAEGNSHW